MSQAREVFERRLEAHQRMLEDLKAVLPDWESCVGLVLAAFRSGNTLFAGGNGGSAADAQHLVAELVNRFELDREPLPALALTTNSSNLTSIANDEAYEQVFAKQIRALGKPGDVLLAFSTSGNSPSVLEAARVAHQRGMRVIAWTGPTGGELAGLSDVCVRVPCGCTATVQEAHILLVHMLCECVDREFAYQPRNTPK